MRGGAFKRQAYCINEISAWLLQSAATVISSPALTTQDSAFE